ncbi:hypothetical protein F5X68DRAFT_211638 [Plectosphaerella plurivora]|uniref:F-box domain-containing protein n=1 Tax=Plectosphaerella plurivora TaxID=936078 RepID=A0A9P8V7X1_9PEZI|nr:hypothetical protein F5X68DRAFT_211638 [Plectosphaerella plurivora]
MPISDLPPELWLRIIESFCSHCNGEECVFRLHKTDLTDIARLCLVSKNLNHMATPILYHVPNSRKPSRLLRTLAAHPELARHVQELHPSLWTFDWPELDHVDNYPPSLMEDFERRLVYAREHLSEDVGDWDLESTVDDHILDAALIALLPNLTRISILSHYRSVCFGFEPSSLPNLRSVSIAHGDTESFLAPRCLKPLADAAPNIASLHLDMFGADSHEVGQDAFPVFPNVTSLMMERSLVTAPSWPFLLQAFPRLETMAFGGTWPSEYIDEDGYALDIQNAVALHCPHLRKLCVDYSDIEFMDDLDETDRTFDHGLASLKELEYLITDSKRIGNPVAEDGLGDVSGICIDALPASLRGLRILDEADYDPSDLGLALIDLAAKVSGRLPFLEKISIVRGKGSYELDDELRSAWDGTGVELTLDVTGTPELGVRDRTRQEWHWP